MSGQPQTSKPIAIRFGGLNPGESPWVKIDYEDGRDTVQRLLDDPEAQRLLIDVVGAEHAS